MTVEDPTAPPQADSFANAALHRAFLLTCFASLLTALAAMWLSPSLPSALGDRLGLAAGALFGLATAWEARDGGYMSAANPRLARPGRSVMMRKAWMRIPLMGLFVFGLMFATVAYGLGGIVTAAVGQPGTRILTITGVSGGRKSCRHFDVREYGLVLGHALCASPDLLDQARPGRTLILRGKVSALGFNVAGMALGPSTASATAP